MMVAMCYSALRKGDTNELYFESLIRKNSGLKKLHFLLRSLILMQLINKLTDTTRSGKVSLYKKILQTYLKNVLLKCGI